MGKEFIARKGLIAKDDSAISGSLSVTQDIQIDGTASIDGIVIVQDSISIGTAVPTSRLHLPAGTINTGTAPIKLTPGINITTPEIGAVEFDGTRIYVTDSGSIPARNTIAYVSDQYTFDTDVGANPVLPIQININETTHIKTVVFDETKVNHNNLLNYEEDRHRKMNYNESIKSYIIES